MREHAVIALIAAYATGGASVLAAFLLSRRRTQGTPEPRGKQAAPLAPVTHLTPGRREPERQRARRSA